ASDVERHLISASVPQLILHVRLLHRALSTVRTRIYVKVGTTGTGGMGLNIPYTHGEDKPSPTLMSKTATAFAHTGLLFLMARTPDCPIIKEIKPAAMIGYRNIGYQQVRGPQFRPVRGGRSRSERVRLVTGEPVVLYECGREALGDTLDNEPCFDRFEPLRGRDGKQERLTLPCVNTGENGIFTRGEFEAITALGQMEFVTPEEIAQLVTLEIQGNNTGRDVISGLDSSILSPSYKGGLIREVAIDELEKLEAEKGVPSVAIGQLGPPQLAKYLYEVFFLRQLYRSVEHTLADEDGRTRRASEVSADMEAAVLASPLRHTITSIGIPILLADGRTILRGPVIKIPPYNKKAHVMELDDDTIDGYARKGWVDLRPAHMQWWLEQFKEMRGSVFRRGSKWSSERLNIGSYLFEEIRIGQVVAWIFNNAIEPRGHRIK
ncbi:MAG TPA: short-chain dehydrogenase, partial [bacterium]|nr:short-chain dehydrogenase [bacterium]